MSDVWTGSGKVTLDHRVSHGRLLPGATDELGQETGNAAAVESLGLERPGKRQRQKQRPEHNRNLEGVRSPEKDQ